MKLFNKQKGSGLVEVVVGLAIILTSIFFLIKTYNYYLRFALTHRSDVQVALLLEEGVEAVKLLRDASWTNKIATLASGTPYSLAFIDSIWTSTTTGNGRYIDGDFDRTFVLSDVYRDSSDSISSSGTLDVGTKKVAISVSYSTLLGTTTKTMSAYITNLFSN